MEEARFWELVEVTEGCHLWRGTVRASGYGEVIRLAGHARRYYPHQAVLVLAGIELLPEHHVDHQCHNQDRTCRGGPACLHRRCVRLDHLEQVSPGENTFRAFLQSVPRQAGRCRNGHDITAPGMLADDGRCRGCQRARERRYRRRKEERLIIELTDRALGR